MKWVIGVDLRPSGSGALQFARWLAASAAREPTELSAVHVLEESYLLQVLRREHLQDVESRALAATRDALARAGLSEVTGTVVRGIVADERLASEVRNVGGDALLIGRQGRTDEPSVVRLGRVARRLVRRLPVPIVVAPPDLEADRVGHGPIILASDIGPDSVAAASFAQRLARERGRRVVVAHIVPRRPDADALIPAVTVEQLYQQMGLDREHDLHGWMLEHGLGEAPAVVAYGNVVERLVGIAQEERAPIVVCGSRGLGTVERLFTSSVATDLSCNAGCAVAVVPSTA